MNPSRFERGPLVGSYPDMRAVRLNGISRTTLAMAVPFGHALALSFRKRSLNRVISRVFSQMIRWTDA